MPRTEIAGGICGFTTTVDAQMEGDDCVLAIASGCAGIMRMAAELPRVDPMREITYRGEGPLILEVAARHCRHTACPVPSGIIKAVEVAAGLALPKDASVRFQAEE